VATFCPFAGQWLAIFSGPLNVLIVPDKFKGTLTARQAAEAIARGWVNARPKDRVELLPLSDGGDGFGAVIGELLNAQKQSVRTIDAAHRPCCAHWWWEGRTKTAIIESAEVVGLAMLPTGRFHPFNLDTFGLGRVLKAAKHKGALKCLVGIGGSATNDGGFGLARTFGWQFLDAQGCEIVQWTDLPGLARIKSPNHRRAFDELRVAVDVGNPLLGPRGATRIYGPQKGLCRAEFSLAERCLRRLSEINERTRNASLAPGSGAAGGLGFGLKAFCGAALEDGFKLFARLGKLKKRLREADLVITGEGALDASTLMGKGVGEIAKLCRRLEIPCIALAGRVELSRANSPFTAAYAVSAGVAPEAARQEAAKTLERLASEVSRNFSEASVRP
jgi:glycerate kinase